MGDNVAPSLAHGHHVATHAGVSSATVLFPWYRAMRDQRAEVFLNIAPDERADDAPLEDRDFRILVLGDFGAHGDDAPLGSASARRIDRDDIDVHVARIAPRLRVGVGTGMVDLAFASMDDFHPDRLVTRLATIAAAIPPALPSASSRAPADATPSRAPDLTRAVSGASLLDDMLDDVVPGAQPTTAPARATDELSAFVERAVAPHLVRPPDAATAASAEAAHRATVDMLRRVLHDPRVQQLEATWRAMEMLVRRLDTDGALHLFMLDVPRVHAATALERMAQHRDVANAESWALVVSLHAYPDGDRGAEALAQLTMAARALAAPVVAAAPPSFAGRQSAVDLDEDTPPASAPEVFTLIRRSLEARFLGLTFPRLLLRAPYGRENPCDTIEFEEVDDQPQHTDFLWGSGAAAVALLVGEAFNERGWAMGPRIALDVGSLPYFMYRRGPEMVALSCAETIMSERVARHLLSRGIMPLAWIKNTDRVRLVELCSVSDPTSPLSAAWAGGTGAAR